MPAKPRAASQAGCLPALLPALLRTSVAGRSLSVAHLVFITFASWRHCATPVGILRQPVEGHSRGSRAGQRHDQEMPSSKGQRRQHHRPGLAWGWGSAAA